MVEEDRSQMKNGRGKQVTGDKMVDDRSQMTKW
jgi:hypothetical protein